MACLSQGGPVFGRVTKLQLKLELSSIFGYL